MEKEEKKDITIADVAEALGVSKTTVSRAISGKGRIGKETRKRVLEYIEEHDYKPNAIAKGLAQSKTYNICVVIMKWWTGISSSAAYSVFRRWRRRSDMTFCLRCVR